MKNFRGISPALILLLTLLTVAAFVLEWIRTPEHPVLAEPPRSTDMAVIGGTAAALLTALHGAQNGAQVYLFPQGQELGEDADFLLSEGLAAPLTPPQRELDEPFLPWEFEDMLRNNGGELNDPALLTAFIQFSNQLYPMLEHFNGAAFDHIPHATEKPYLHVSNLPINSTAFVRRLQARVLQAGVIISDDYVKELILSPGGEITGLLLAKSGGGTEILNLPSVVLADGGYSGDPFSWHPYLPKGNLILLRPGQQGRGLRLATEMGMDLVQTSFYRRRLLLFSPFNEAYCLLNEQPGENAYFFNNGGQLLEWSESSEQEILNFIHMSPPDGVYLIVIEEDIPEDCTHLFLRFADWESLARFIGGELPSFPRPYLPADVHLVSRVRVGVDYTIGGLAVTPLGQVKRKGSVVTGLFAAGEICGGLHGGAVLHGMPLSETLFFSAVVGEAAAHHAWR